MKKYRVLFSMFAILAICLSVLPTMTAHAENEDRLKIEAVGFFTHYPMQETKLTIESVCDKFEGQVELTLYDETKAEGIDFMDKMGLSGHIPMRLYIEGDNTFIIDGKEVSFRDFVGYEWAAEDLEMAIAMSLEGADIATEGSNEKGGGFDPLFIAAAAIFVVAVGGIVFILIRGKKSAKAKGKSDVR